MSTRTGGEHRSAGFTLLELVIAVAVAGLILVGLSAGLRFDLRALRSADRHIAAFDEVTATEDTLRHLIAEARGLNGSGDRLAFVGALPSALDRPGLFDIRLGIDPSHKLTLSWTQHHAADDTAGADRVDGDASGRAGSTALLDGVAGLEFAYYTQGPDRGEGWQTATAKDLPPKLLRIRVRLSPGDHRRWLALVIRPWVAAAAPKAGQL